MSVIVCERLEVAAAAVLECCNASRKFRPSILTAINEKKDAVSFCYQKEVKECIFIEAREKIINKTALFHQKG